MVKRWRFADLAGGQRGVQSKRNDESKDAGMQPLSEILRELLPGQRLVATSESALRTAWPQAVGNLAARTSIVRFVDDCLLVAVDSPAWMTELQFHRDAIRARLLDQGLVVEEIRFVVAGRRARPASAAPVKAASPKPSALTAEQTQRVKAATHSIAEGAVRDALERLFGAALRGAERSGAAKSRKRERE